MCPPRRVYLRLIKQHILPARFFQSFLLNSHRWFLSHPGGIHGWDVADTNTASPVADGIGIELSFYAGRFLAWGKMAGISFPVLWERLAYRGDFLSWEWERHAGLHRGTWKSSLPFSLTAAAQLDDSATAHQRERKGDRCFAHVPELPFPHADA